MTRTVATAIAVALAIPVPAAAHRLDEYLQASRVLLERDRLLIEIDLTPGANVASGVIAAIDRDQDGAVSPAEAQAYGLAVLEDVIVTLDARATTLSLQRIEIPPLDELREGLGTIRLEAIGSTGAIAPGRHAVDFHNQHRAATSVYLVNALLPRDGMATVLSQQRDSRQSRTLIEYDVARTAAPIGWVSVAGVTLIGLAAFRRRRGLGPPAHSRAAAAVH